MAPVVGQGINRKVLSNALSIALLVNYENKTIIVFVG